MAIDRRRRLTSPSSDPRRGAPSSGCTAPRAPVARSPPRPGSSRSSATCAWSGSTAPASAPRPRTATTSVGVRDRPRRGRRPPRARPHGGHRPVGRQALRPGGRSGAARPGRGRRGPGRGRADRGRTPSAEGWSPWGRLRPCAVARAGAPGHGPLPGAAGRPAAGEPRASTSTPGCRPPATGPCSSGPSSGPCSSTT